MSFENASVTKGLMVGCALTSILVGLFDVKHYFHLQLVPHLSRHHQYWRLAVHHLAFSNSSDLFIAELLLYNAGVQVERQFGSVKYASFAAVATLLATILELSALMLFHRTGLNHFAMGPVALIFSILYQYSRIVPSAYNYRIFGVPLNNKSLIYLLSLQMAISRLPNSAAVCIIGILTGQVYRSDLANLKAYRLPPSVIKLSRRFLQPLVGSLRPARRSNRALPEGPGATAVTRNSETPTQENDEVITTARTVPGATPRATITTDEDNTADTGSSVMREWVNELTGRTERANAGIRVPPEAEIIQLTTMFPDVQRETLVQALQRR
ncbi:hypothetical protein BDZ94DRAFT_1166697 [Collybia nuda]|uniref:Derlin n=1 Tax=Collybia nuda TaxID=64659 RepID=A0A9P6CH97_9AGAR|nr:hypothetical protein BDZ94DRAFT_1166697 [Collybia nuda]